MTLLAVEEKIQKLIDAVIVDDVNAVKKLLESGVNPNSVLDAEYITPLHFAAQNNSWQVIPLLLAAGANIYAKTAEDGVTPLEVAKLHKHPKIVALLTTTCSGCANSTH